MTGHVQQGHAGALAFQTQTPARLTETTTPNACVSAQGAGMVPQNSVAPPAHPGRDPYRARFMAALARLAKHAVEEGRPPALAAAAGNSEPRGHQPRGSQGGGDGDVSASTP